MNPPHPEVKWIQHNTHSQHPLKEVYKNSKFECKGCKFEGRGTRYWCEPCNFNLHTICATCPVSIRTFIHPQHELELRPQKPFLSDPKCMVCQMSVQGLVYQCKDCKLFLHPLCSQLPEFLAYHALHPPHTLRVQNMSSKKCDVCEKSCKNWRYFCGICDVHIHIGCLSSNRKGKRDEDEFYGLFGGLLADLASVITGGFD